MQIYNSLSNSKETLIPIVPVRFGVYSCGPTVYDHAHIGNLRTFINTDLLVRVLHIVEGLDVRWVMNITDIDDKMIDRMKQDYPGEDPQAALKKLADKYIAIFHEDITKVNIDPKQIHFIRATESIALMQQLIRQLMNDGFAYVSDGSVYFNIASYQKAGHRYGVLINLHYDGQARVTDDQDQKEGVADFALWKAKKEGEPFWEFELDGQSLPGRPGWHIECSAMSIKELGQPFDVHTGGIDLKFPHHENEIAQCEGELAHYFVHSEHLHVNAEKMSKSKNNYVTLTDIDDPLAFRYLVLQTHYRSQMDFTDASLRAAHERLNNLRAYVDQLKFGVEILPEHDDSNTTRAFNERFTEALANDLNSPEALAAFSLIEGKVYSAETLRAIEGADGVLGLDLVQTDSLPVVVTQLISQYDNTRARRDYTESDNLRGHIEQMGYRLNNTKYGTLVSKIRQ